MDIEINEVHEIIKNLDSGGELSIKEEKYLKVAKLCVQLAAERDAALNAERAWEKTMMEVCGEDGHASVAAVINALAAENAALKDINAWCKTDAFKNMYREFKTAESLGCSDVDCMHDAMLVAIMHAPATPATDRIVAGIKADGVEMFVEKCREKSKQAISSDIRDNWWLVSEHADDFAKQLREGADK